MKKLLRRIMYGAMALAVIVLLVLARPRITEFLNDKPDALSAARFWANDAWSTQLVDSEQVVFVMTDATETNSAIVTAFSRQGDEPWQVARGPYRATIGTNGFVSPEVRTEGSDTTPIGVFDITGAFGGQAAPSGTRLPYDVIGIQYQDCWISDQNDPAYNRWVLRPVCEGQNVKLGDRSSTIFKSAIIFDFNATDRVPGRGSALFIHSAVTDDNGNMRTTFGGIALHDGDVRDLIKWLDPKANPRLVMGPESQLPLPASLAGSSS